MHTLSKYPFSERKVPIIYDLQSSLELYSVHGVQNCRKILKSGGISTYIPSRKAFKEEPFACAKIRGRLSPFPPPAPAPQFRRPWGEKLITGVCLGEGGLNLFPLGFVT